MLTPDIAYNFIILCCGIGIMYVSFLLYVYFVRDSRVYDYWDLFFRAILAVAASAGFYLVLVMLVKFFELGRR